MKLDALLYHRALQEPQLKIHLFKALADPTTWQGHATSLVVSGKKTNPSLGLVFGRAKELSGTSSDAFAGGGSLGGGPMTPTLPVIEALATSGSTNSTGLGGGGGIATLISGGPFGLGTGCKE